MYQPSAAVSSFKHDGLEIARVKNERRWLPVWHIIFFVYLALLVRLVAMADIGPGAYAGRIDDMRNGNLFERAAAYVMHMDPVSQQIAISLRRGMREWGML
jgi:hypothetical protein